VTSAEKTDRLAQALRIATDALLAEMSPAGHWVGELSSSALSTGTAVTALALVDRERHGAWIHGGLRWLAANRNPDGGWGDTVRSKSNISTTALVWAAFGAAQADENFRAVVDRAASWLRRASRLDETPEPTDDPFRAALSEAIARRYGKDRTFSVPILTMLAISGRLDWQCVMPLPFELAALPHQLFGALHLPVVSYALPALIAIGQTVHHHRPSRNFIMRFIRDRLRAKTLRVLESIQPKNGGFLEATPLTSFVTMSLAAMGLKDHTVVRRGADFLIQSARADGSWPIDTNLATWTTTLAIKALSHQRQSLSPEQRMTLREWLLGQQYRKEHPYTHAAPGGWAWTDLPGGVPDADDTPGALLALAALGLIDGATQQAGEAGVRWLLGLQNRDGGIPTFCRGWGALPFDRSAPDLTAHTLRAWSTWLPHLPDELAAKVEHAIGRAIGFLAKTQRADGSWLPLWFGHQDAPEDENPLYGTAHVLIALRELDGAGFSSGRRLSHRATQWIAAAQNEDGGWGGVRGVPSSTEETALAVDALAATAQVEAVDRGARWLVDRIESGAWREPAPIGFYFAKLWYFERLYPLVWTVGALAKVEALRK
jgi:squalene-hopene/tetraprenyl-beta-curcumene cyclase